jgi:hypothetical protein
MDSTLIFVMMISVGLFMAILPFGVFLGLGNVLATTSDDPRLLVTYILAALILSYLLALGAFALIQNHNCGKVNMKQAASNAGISLGIQSLTLLLVWLVPSLRGVVTNLLPPDSDKIQMVSVGYSYWSMWAALFGIAIGGTLSGVCS